MLVFLAVVQLIFIVIVGVFMMQQAKGQKTSKVSVKNDSSKEMDNMRRMRRISLTQPFSELTRPEHMEDIVGQEEGIMALRAAICSPHPQHVIIYGPPGVGKTCAARLLLKEAQENPSSPFGRNAKFVEMDATCLRFDERGIADPLIGSVHDPIYQGAGALGVAGVPQPKMGAVSKAHGGILFLDEIGELHPIQLNRLLKVLEDRRVLLESSYYNERDENIPSHIHDIFQNGLPADFRLVGATTRTPADIPPALRSRCVEVFFQDLGERELVQIAQNASKKSGYPIQSKGAQIIGEYAANGRDAVNIVQMAAGLVSVCGRDSISAGDVEWVMDNCRYSKVMRLQLPVLSRVGCVNGMAVCNTGRGVLMRIEAHSEPVAKGCGEISLTGVADQEELGNAGHKLIRKSAIRSSVENVCTVLRGVLGIPIENYNIHINFPGALPVDGPSAGVAIACAVYSAITGRRVNHLCCLTGELSIMGDVLPVGGTTEKLKAACASGIKLAYIPAENWQENYAKMPVKVIPVEDIFMLLNSGIFLPEPGYSSSEEVLSASGGYLAGVAES